ncbi:hypothetical protein CAP31_00560 [Sulfuriferula sp. AH1]|uniref:hypothetical protein n=1 Tax=Sulfuriferula sp. AH1 TaxID=1985873 RepID=UPI000B3B5859|nr:hypothetical protein [Sulfuriferula sp. AH1]ARU30311.1 hypothetical protein CAP31_00560 [Sulfuriferula sp. AH1]
MNTKSTLALTLGSAFIATAGMNPAAQAAQNPFVMQTLDKGYMTAEADTVKSGKAAEMNCGASMNMGGSKKAIEQKTPKAVSAKPAVDKKSAEAKCGAAK